MLFDVMDELRACGHSCGLILTGRGAIADLEKLTRNRVACVRQYVEIPALKHGDIAACLNAWCKEGADLVERAKSEPEALEVLHTIAKSTDGNILRVKRFAEIKNDKFAGRKFTRGLVLDVFSELRGGSAATAKK